MEPLERLLVLTQKDSRTNNLDDVVVLPRLVPIPDHPCRHHSPESDGESVAPNPPTNGRRIRERKERSTLVVLQHYRSPFALVAVTTFRRSRPIRAHRGAS